MVLALAALAAAAASFPTGFGFGAGYGAGVRVGYDIIYPKLAPFATKITDDLISSMASIWGTDNDVPTQPTDFKFVPEPKQGPLEKPDSTIIPKGRSREIADTCDFSHKRWTALQRRILSLNASLVNATSRRTTTGRHAMQRARQAQSFRSELTKVSRELDDALKNPNNQSCASTWDPKAAF